MVIFTVLDEPVSLTQPLARPQPRGAYKAFMPITTRWADNDVYGHVNNVVYYSWFDTAVNGYLMQQGVLDIHHGSTIGLVVQTQCDYFAPVACPQAVTAGLRVAHMGRSSVRYDVGLFADDALLSNAVGHFAHVYDDRATRKSAPLPDNLQAVVHGLMVTSLELGHKIILPIKPAHQPPYQAIA